MHHDHAPDPERVPDIVVLDARDDTASNLLEAQKLWLHATTKDGNAIGFLPLMAWINRVEQNNVTTIRRNGDLVGLIVYAKSPLRRVMKIFQIWVRPDARIIEHGRALLSRVLDKAALQDCYMAEAYVAEDLPANFFWACCMFKRTNWRYSKGKTDRKIWRWIKEVSPCYFHLQKQLLHRKEIT